MKSSATSRAAAPATANGMEQRLLTFAEQLGWMAGTIQSKAQNGIDREALRKQIASVRDGATQLLEQLASAVTIAPKAKPSRPARGGNQGRSGGVVDAPGKRHRKPAPADPRVARASSQAATLRAARSMEKTSRPRARA